MDLRRLLKPGAGERIAKLLQTQSTKAIVAEKVSADTLRKLIREGPGSDALKTRFLDFVEPTIAGHPWLSAMVLGMAVGFFAEHMVSKGEEEEFIAMTNNMNDLDKLPLVDDYLRPLP